MVSGRRMSRVTTNDILTGFSFNSDLIIGFVLKGSSFFCVIDYLFEHHQVLGHQVTYFRIQGILAVGIGHYEDQPADNHGQGDRGGVILSNKRQTNSPFVSNIGMIQLRWTFYLWRVYRVAIGKGELKVDLGLMVGRVFLGSDAYLSLIHI